MQITFDDTLGNSNKENVSVTSSSTVHRWPQLQTLVQHSEYQQVVVKVLAAVDETGATSELKCRNSSDPKGNKWVKLHDMFFGGDSFRRGLGLGQSPLIPKIRSFQFGSMSSTETEQRLILSLMKSSCTAHGSFENFPTP